ncbi:Rv1355c family protein [Nocardia inohanensis]|uniref:Rv1355c family protein n=1 Tax=Nocardia inohanensis TaxID=209246 RepID=UPI0008351DC0|nr:Rv1355c family protein [Nocardia inohanensis]
MNYRPTIYRLGEPADAAAVQELERSGAIAERRDEIQSQLENLAKIRSADRGRFADRDDVVADLLGATPRAEYGVWVHYPWSRLLVHTLDEAEFVEVRTAANRNKLTAREQELLRGKTVGVIGLSVGSAVALTIALERSCGTIKLADFDELELSNLNRLSAAVAEIGVNKAVLTARRIAELDPYLDVKVYEDGVDDLNIEMFLGGERPLDLVVEECDMPFVKLLVRERARARGIPVVMEASDRGVLDIERFDLEPERPIMHGLLGELSTEMLEEADLDVQLAAMATMIGVDGISDRIAASVIEMDRTLTTWPQLASEVNHGGAVVATAVRGILLGQQVPSGRRSVELPHGIGFTPLPAPRPVIAEPVTAEPAELPEDIREILEAAMRSPSGGNSQEWRFLLRGSVIEVAHAPERTAAHPLMDSRGNAHRIVMGVVTESIVVAARARGLDATVEYDPHGTDSDVYTRITLAAGTDPEPAEIALAEALTTRFAQRTRATGRALGERERAALVSATTGFSSRLHLSSDATVKQRFGAGVAVGNRLRVLVDRMHTEAFHEFYFGADHPDRLDGVPVENLQLTFPERTALRLLRRPKVAEFLHERGEGTALLQFSQDWAENASLVGAFTCASESRRDVVEAGRAFQRLWLTATAAGIGIHPTTALLCEAELLLTEDADVFDAAEQQEIGTHLAQLRESLLEGSEALVGVAFRVVAGVTEPAAVPSPRRPLAQHLTVLPVEVHA